MVDSNAITMYGSGRRSVTEYTCSCITKMTWKVSSFCAYKPVHPSYIAAPKNSNHTSKSPKVSFLTPARWQQRWTSSMKISRFSRFHQRCSTCFNHSSPMFLAHREIKTAGSICHGSLTAYYRLSSSTCRSSEISETCLAFSFSNKFEDYQMRLLTIFGIGVQRQILYLGKSLFQDTFEFKISWYIRLSYELGVY